MPKFINKEELSAITILVFFTTFTLPMYMGINNLLLGLFVGVSIIKNLRNNYRDFQSSLRVYIPLFLFFILALIASVNNTDHFFIKHLEKYWSFLLLPIAFALNGSDIKKLFKYAFNGLVYGCAITLLICYSNIFYEMVTNSEPLSYFLRWRHLSHDFTSIADTHPAYLGLFICFSTYYLLFQETGINKGVKISLIVLFTLGMLQLVSRMALFIYTITLGFYFVRNLLKYIKQFAVVGALISVAIALFYFYGSDYLQNRIFSSESVEKDGRFERLQISYDIFKEYPIFGVGLDKIEEERVDRYTDYGYIVAAHHKYNAHNQFMEYLSSNGIIGGVIYIGVLLYVIGVAIKRKNYFFLFFIMSFILANLTESMMVRIKGIEYFTIFSVLFLSKYKTGLIKLT
ncbi:O-antigen ligase [Mangrovimonas sp. TPBH4]|uniref:O-antigen ligase family protein n=1 Tax=Mangrovimonas sp. TPBH4 TaxID=1645914 RepID=UPI0006B43994|nr:O-antigen ligase family protein [Mangrovimonas sp. TPBH4]